VFRQYLVTCLCLTLLCMYRCLGLRACSIQIACGLLRPKGHLVRQCLRGTRSYAQGETTSGTLKATDLKYYTSYYRVGKGLLLASAVPQWSKVYTAFPTPKRGQVFAPRTTQPITISPALNPKIYNTNMKFCGRSLAGFESYCVRKPLIFK
jgi:hypothetical protein